MDELNACWNNVICRLFGYNKWESVSALLLSLERLNVKHLIRPKLHKINFYKRLLYSSDVFLSIIRFALFCIITVTMVFYLNLCFIVNLMPFTVSGQPFRTMFYIFVTLLLRVLLFRVYTVCPLSVLLPVLANKDVHMTWWTTCTDMQAVSLTFTWARRTTTVLNIEQLLLREEKKQKNAETGRSITIKSS